MNLVRGQRAKLAELTAERKISVVMELDGLPVSQVVWLALLLGERQEAIAGTSVLMHEDGRSDCGGIAARPRSGVARTFELDLGRLSSSVRSLLFAVALLGRSKGELGSASNLRTVRWRIEGGGRDLAGFEIEGREFGSDAGISLGEIYRKDGAFRLRAVGEGYAGGLSTMLSRFKVTPGLFPDGAGRPGEPGLRSATEGIWLPAAPPGGRAPSVPKDLTRAVGLVITKTAEEIVHTGTGFVITPGGHFLTCHHVVEDARELAIAIDGTGVLRTAQVLHSDADADLALCWISDGNGCTHWNILAGNETSSELGDDLGMLGYPLGVNLGISVTYSQGIINSLRRRGETPVLQIDVGAAPGSSGGPVFRRSDGVVIGVLTSGLDIQKGMHINFASDIKSVYRLGWIR